MPLFTDGLEEGIVYNDPLGLESPGEVFLQPAFQLRALLLPGQDIPYRLEIKTVETSRFNLHSLVHANTPFGDTGRSSLDNI